MAKASVSIRLALGEDDGVWVTTVPVHTYINERRSRAIARAAGDALVHFLASVLRDGEEITERMVREETLDEVLGG